MAALMKREACSPVFGVQAFLLHLPEPLYVIERFDRAPDAETIRRLHQIDLCQALGVSPSKKYESEGGLGLQHLFDLVRSAFIDRPIVATNAILQWVAFNYLVGNLDAHAKNIGSSSFSYGGHPGC